MKVGSFTPSNGRVENIRIFRPIQTLLVKVDLKGASNDGITVRPQGIRSYVENKMKVNVTLQNSASGHLSTLIPYIEISKLADISTYNEGYSVVKDNSVLYPIMLGISKNLSVDNDKYIDISFLDIPDYVERIHINSFEVGENSDFVSFYQKMAAPSGVARYKVNTENSEFLSLPLKGFDEVQLTFYNGLTATYDKTDLFYLMAQNNDITAVLQSDSGLTVGGVVSTTSSNVHDGVTLIHALHNDELIVKGNSNIYLSHSDNFVLDLDEVETLEIIRDTDCINPFEFILGDFVDSKKPVSKNLKTDKK